MGFKGVRNVRNGNAGGNTSRDAHIEREGYMINEKGVPCITGCHRVGTMGGAAKAKKDRAIAMDDNHSHIAPLHYAKVVRRSNGTEAEPE